VQSFRWSKDAFHRIQLAGWLTVFDVVAFRVTRILRTKLEHGDGPIAGADRQRATVGEKLRDDAIVLITTHFGAVRTKIDVSPADGHDGTTGASDTWELRYQALALRSSPVTEPVSDRFGNVENATRTRRDGNRFLRFRQKEKTYE
jgi:hypothetical protein